eukprot:403369954
MALLTSRNVRAFATQSTSSEYSVYDDNFFYTPVREVKFQNGVSEIFNNNDLQSGEPKYTPWELKETTLKNFLGVFGLVSMNYFLGLPPFAYSLGTAFFGINWMNTVYGYMGHAIVKIDLHEDGKNITITYKFGNKQTLRIKDIVKLQHEKELIQTFEEGFMFPVSVPTSADKSQTLYIYGSSQEAIKNGEVFRAIINGQAIKV